MIELSHVDTCLPCYVLDHCNGSHEQLFGVSVDRSSRMYRVKADLLAEIRNFGDKIPESISEAEIESAVNALFAGIHPFTAFDCSLESVDDNTDEYCYAWFRATWESVE